MVSRLRNFPSFAVVSSRERSLPLSLLVLAIVCALAIVLRVPVQFPMPGYFDDIRTWSSYWHIDDTFTPLAYPLFAAPAYRLAGTAGIVVLQAILFVALVWLALRMLDRLELPVAWAATGSLLILFHPEFSLSISKIWDVDLSTFLLLLVVLLCLRLQAGGPKLRTNLELGIALGAAVFCRPNYALLVAALIYVLFFSSLAASLRSRWMAFTMACIMAALVFALLGAASHGTPFLPRNGPYNFFAGSNPYSARALLDELNAEPSMRPAFAAAYPPPLPDLTAPDVFYNPDLEPFYNHQAVLFVREHPLEELRLVGVKLFTLFRPDTKVHGLHSAQGMVKLLLALPAVVFLLLLVVPGRPPLTGKDRLLLIVDTAYILPFLLTNSDPRFRIPLDALLLLHGVRLVYLRQRSRTAGVLPVSCTP